MVTCTVLHACFQAVTMAYSSHNKHQTLHFCSQNLKRQITLGLLFDLVDITLTQVVPCEAFNKTEHFNASSTLCYH